MNNIYLGKFVSTHGINGELKLLSDFDKKDYVYKKDFKLYINNKIYTISSCRPHKQYELIKLNNFNNINEVLYLVNSEVFINREDLGLKSDEYLLEELVGAKVIDEDISLGIITEVLLSKYNNYIKVNDSFLIPLIDIYIKKYDQDNKILYTKNAKDLKLN